MKKFYEIPTQVWFKQADEDVDQDWIGGIAFNDYVICGCCGAVIPLTDIAKIVELPWVSISNEIGGEEYPGDED